MHTRTAVLIPAAGTGSRLGGKVKQYRSLGGRPVLVRTLQAFDGLVSMAVVAVPPGDEQRTEALISEHAPLSNVRVVAGGNRRCESVCNAFDQLEEELEVILVHDAVRPFVERGTIERVIAATLDVGAAAAAVPVVDTLRRAEGGRFTETIARKNVYHMQTPQGFRTEILRKACSNARAGEWDVTDDVEMATRSGFEVGLVEGSRANMKITTAEDWIEAVARYDHTETGGA